MSFQIQRLRVEQLRQFRAPYELNHLAPGLNIFTGPNEAGKSTLVRAIRAAFFERHRSTAVDDLRPWGDSSASPSVELDFVLHGEPHSLKKSFLGCKRCDLTLGTRHLEGTDAEDHLAQVFGFAFASKGASRQEHWGVPGLLWVQQGEGQELAVSHARDHLHQALTDQAGGAVAALATTGGDALLSKLKSQRDELLTSTGKPRADYDKAITHVSNLQARLSELDAQVATYRQQVDELARLQQQHREDEATKPWEALATQLAQAQAQQQAIEQLQQQLTEDEATLAQLQATRTLLQTQLDDLAAQDAAATTRAQALERAQAQQASATATLDTARQQQGQAAERDAQARTHLATAQLIAQHQAIGSQLQQAQQQLAKAQTAWQRAHQAQQQLAQVRAQAPARRITQAEVTALAQLEQTLREAALRKDSVATRIVFELEPGRQVQVTQGEHTRSVQGQEELRIAGPTQVQLPGLGTMRIAPGGEELEPLLRAHHKAEQAFQTELARLGLQSLEQARQLAQTLAEHAQQLTLAEKALELVAPEGLPALEAARDTAQQRATELQASLQALPPAPDGESADLRACAQEAKLAEAALQQAQSAWQQAQLAHARGQAQLEQAEQEWQAAQQLLQGEQRAARLARTQQALQAQAHDESACQQRLAHTRQQLASANPGFVKQDIERLQRSIAQQQAQHQQRREDIRVLHNTLQLAGAQGLDEQRATLAGELEHAQRRKAQLQRRAQALDHLCTQLEAKRQQSLMRLQQPLLERLQHYLPLLFPGASLEVSDDLSPNTLVRPRAGGAPEAGAVDALSFGSREQIGLVCRFAYADLLAQAGKPTLLILDDALVHSDDGRLAQMKRVLYDVAQRHQVLVFTCHPNAWRDMGASMREIGVSAA